MDRFDLRKTANSASASSQVLGASVCHDSLLQYMGSPWLCNFYPLCSCYYIYTGMSSSLPPRPFASIPTTPAKTSPLQCKQIPTLEMVLVRKSTGSTVSVQTSLILAAGVSSVFYLLPSTKRLTSNVPSDDLLRYHDSVLFKQRHNSTT